MIFLMGMEANPAPRDAFGGPVPEGRERTMS